MTTPTTNRLSVVASSPTPAPANGYATVTEPAVRGARRALAGWAEGTPVALKDAPGPVRKALEEARASHGGMARVEVRRVSAEGRDFFATRVTSGRTTEIIPYGALYDSAGAHLNDYEEPDGKRFFFPSPAEQRYDARVGAKIEALFHPKELGTHKLTAREVSSPDVTRLLAKAMPKEPGHAHGSKTYRFEVDGRPYYARFHAQGTLVELTPTWGGPPRFETAGPSLSLFDDQGRSVGQWTVDARRNSFGWNTVRHAWGQD